MTLTQIEYCHNCSRMVEFAFEDVTGNQLIICPTCGHQHYRVIDEATLTNIRVHPNQRTLTVIEFPPLRWADLSDGKLSDTVIPLTRKNYEILGTKDGQAVVKGMEGKKTQVVTQHRWGVDPRQLA